MFESKDIDYKEIKDRGKGICEIVISIFPYAVFYYLYLPYTICMKPLIYITLLLTISLNLTGQESGFEYLSPDQFIMDYQAEVFAILIDVRVKKEYRKEHIRGAINLPGFDQLNQFADTLDTETPLYIYCDTYTRSETVAEHLIERGFTNLSLLQDGINGWKRNGLEVVNRREKRK